jgi:hypothetical protein
VAVPLPPAWAIVIEGSTAMAKSACTLTVVGEEVDPV